jgi:hypothetical protein
MPPSPTENQGMIWTIVLYLGPTPTTQLLIHTELGLGMTATHVTMKGLNTWLKR